MTTQHPTGKAFYGVEQVLGDMHVAVWLAARADEPIAVCGYAQADDYPESFATARRLAACWNACEGIPTEALERGGALGDQIVGASTEGATA